MFPCILYSPCYLIEILDLLEFYIFCNNLCINNVCHTKNSINRLTLSSIFTNLVLLIKDEYELKKFITFKKKT